MRAEPVARILFRIPAGSQSVKLGSAPSSCGLRQSLRQARNVRGEEEKMNGNETCVFGFGHLRNAHGEPSHSARVFMDERARRILQDQNHDYALNEAILATKEERALKTKLLTHLLERLVPLHRRIDGLI